MFDTTPQEHVITDHVFRGSKLEEHRATINVIPKYNTAGTLEYENYATRICCYYIFFTVKRSRFSCRQLSFPEVYVVIETNMSSDTLEAHI